MQERIASLVRRLSDPGIGFPLRVVRLDQDETFLDGQGKGLVLLPALRDRERTAMKVRYVYGNDASRALDIFRAAVLLNSIEALHAALSAFETGLRQAKWEIAGATDRIKNPTPGGYRDLLLYLRLPNDFICTLQFQLYPMLAAKAQAHPLYVEARRIVARASATQPYSVLICDLFNYQMEEEEFVLGGFSSLEKAREFARRWVRDSVEELRAKGRKREEHRLLWLLFGEDALVIEDAYAGSDELDLFLAEPASQAETDWRAIFPET